MQKSAMQVLLYLVILIGLTACASSVKRADSVTTEPNWLIGQKYGGISVSLSEEMKSKLSGNLTFNTDEFKNTIKNAAEGGGLISPTSEYSIHILLTDIRVRSVFNAVMFGFMAGDDHLVGTVTITDKNKKVLKSFEVSASYALGGLAGGQDSMRMSWLYQKFAELTVAELKGQKSA
ncbi:MAG: DUF4410 domain-containing protein [Candidatus Contendobacter sp.]|nr:DUF4410 domain-containing protein [Candidatus Contendobacter sp.]